MQSMTRARPGKNEFDNRTTELVAEKNPHGKRKNGESALDTPFCEQEYEENSNDEQNDPVPVEIGDCRHQDVQEGVLKRSIDEMEDRRVDVLQKVGHCQG